MDSKKLLKRLTAVLALVVLTAAGFLLGRMTGRGPVTGETGKEEPGARKVLYWQAPMNPTEIYDAPGKSKMGMDLVPVYADEEEASQKPAGGERKILYWQAPMDPTEIYDAPGKSSMGMDLIPVYDDEAKMGAGGTITVDPAVIQNMGVRTAPVERMEFSRVIRTVGEVDYDEERLFIVNSKIDGWIEKLYVNFVGEEVLQGAPLMEIYSPELVSTQQEYLLAVKNYETASRSGVPSVVQDAERLLKSARTRLEYWDIPAEEITQLEHTGLVKKTMLLKAPATGIVITRKAIEGAYIKAGMDLFEIADLRTVWVHASFYDNEVPWISQGQKVKMELSYLPGKVYTGRVSYVYPYLRKKARDVHVRLIFSNPNLDLKPGMYATVRLQGKVIPNSLVVPTEAVIRSGARNITFVARGEGRFEPREVRIGEEGGPGNGYLRIISGLLEGEEVVTSAQFMLDSESRLQEAIQKMLEERSQRPSAAAGPGETSNMSSGPPSAEAETSASAQGPAPAGDRASEAEQTVQPVGAMPEMDHPMQQDSTMSGMNHQMPQEGVTPGMDHQMPQDRVVPGMDHRVPPDSTAHDH